VKEKMRPVRVREKEVKERLGMPRKDESGREREKRRFLGNWEETGEKKSSVSRSR